MKFNGAGPDGLIDRKPPGQSSRLNDRHRAALAGMIESGPIAAVHGVVRWRIIDLCQWVWEEFRVSIAQQTLSRELRKMGYRKLSARPRHHAQAAGAIEAFKKSSRPSGRNRRGRRRRAGRHRGLVRRWLSSDGDQPHRPEEQDHPPLGAAWNPPVRSARPPHRLDLHLRRHLPEGGQGGRADPAVVQHRGDEPPPRGDLGRHRPRTPRRPGARPGRLASLGQVRRAGQHHPRAATGKVPEHNSQENIWQFLRDNWLSNRVFLNADDLVDHCCDAWNKLEAQPWRTMSIGMREWAHRSRSASLGINPTASPITRVRLRPRAWHRERG